MTEESFVSKVVHAVIFLAICFAILAIGWNEPLRYRFLSAREIEEIERPPATPAPEPTPSWIEGRYGGSKLDGPTKPWGSTHQSRGVRSLDR